MLMLVTIGAACGDDDEASTDGASEGESLSAEPEVEAQEIEIVVPGGEDGEYAYEAGLDGLTAGPVTVTLTNEGALEHQAMLLRLNEGEDVASFTAAAAADPSGVEAFGVIEAFGGPNGVGPGETVSSTQVLEEGDYLLICVIPGEDGVPHAAHGMVTPFSVGPAEGGGTPEPVVDDPDDADVVLVDFGFSPSTDMAAGDTITVGNDGEQAHELVVYRLDEGVTAEQAREALADPASGPPPVTPAGGTGAIAPGGSVEMTLPDEPGEYLLICFLPDTAGDAQPHHAHGMASGLSLA
ncbi:MAG TPA: hypothetical protein VIL48_02935 [Acidimicrobiales bacterium]